MSLLDQQGRLVIEPSNATSRLVGGFADFGFDFYDRRSGGVAIDVYNDDIVRGTASVGCVSKTIGVSQLASVPRGR